MVAWDDAKKPEKTENREIERLAFGKDPTRIRLVGEVLPRYVRWVVTNEGKKFPLECLSFNRETQQFESDLEDPFNEIPESVYGEKPTFAYVCNCIDRKDKKVKLFDLKRTIYSQIVEFARDPDYGNPAAVDTGYDLQIVKEKTGPLAQNVRYNVTPRPNKSPLTEEEKALRLYDLDKMYKRLSYDEQKKWLLDNTSYFAGTDDSFKETAEDLND